MKLTAAEEQKVDELLVHIDALELSEPVRFSVGLALMLNAVAPHAPEWKVNHFIDHTLTKLRKIIGDRE